IGCTGAKRFGGAAGRSCYAEECSPRGSILGLNEWRAVTTKDDRKCRETTVAACRLRSERGEQSIAPSSATSSRRSRGPKACRGVNQRRSRIGFAHPKGNPNENQGETARYSCPKGSILASWGNTPACSSECRTGAVPDC